MDKQFHEYAHNIARNYNTEDYDDVYQQAWVYLMEARESGVKGIDCFFEARFRSNLWANFQNRLVVLPPRTGSKELAEVQETDHEVYDHTVTTSDHAEAYELLSEVKHLRRNISKLTEMDQKLLHDMYVLGKSTRDLSEETGLSHQVWHKHHTSVINVLKSLQERK
jgi:DNA-directed RNA polymerase specialized sigma24 family protein